MNYFSKYLLFKLISYFIFLFDDLELSLWPYNIIKIFIDKNHIIDSKYFIKHYLNELLNQTIQGLIKTFLSSFL